MTAVLCRRLVFLAALFGLTGAAHAAGTGYLGPAGSWTHEACADLFGEADLRPLDRAALFAAYRGGEIERMCVPVTTVAVGVTPYVDDVLDLPQVRVVAEYPKPLSYSLLAKPGARLEDVSEVVAHSVALVAVKPWLDVHLPAARRTEAVSNGAAAKSVAEGQARSVASMGPKLGERIYGLKSLADGIEEGPHNITRFWVLGRALPAPSGNDKTSLVIDTVDGRLADVLKAFDAGGVRILDIYERPSKVRLDQHRYLIEVAGHAAEGNLATFLAAHPEIQVLGSYPRKY
ncbi:prephenate dehydratase [Phenylobacterium immobile]|uniref:prephenate dehydratase n=1 Tax=Phenylobacterium immobile TaxID=21 RepID=UPI000A4ADB9E|nr:prephenate dehydratase domain-containing protein [Phenylobacterium immobile]